jgi:hypothetical protein
VIYLHQDQNQLKIFFSHRQILIQNKMAGPRFPCDACKFLRKKCEIDCVFAPYFSHEQGAAFFPAIHKVFGAKNFSKLLTHLPVSDRGDAAISIAYEAQARDQDPIYGCVAHIFALQQQVISLQSQVAFLKEPAAQSLVSGFDGSNYPANDVNGSNGGLPSDTPPPDIQTWFQQPEHPYINMPPFPEINNMNEPMSFNSLGNYENSIVQENDVPFSSFPGSSNFSIDAPDMQVTHDNEWFSQENAEDLHSVVSGYIPQ